MYLIIIKKKNGKAIRVCSPFQDYLTAEFYASQLQLGKNELAYIARLD